MNILCAYVTLRQEVCMLKFYDWDMCKVKWFNKPHVPISPFNNYQVMTNIFLISSANGDYLEANLVHHVILVGIFLIFWHTEQYWPIKRFY